MSERITCLTPRRSVIPALNWIAMKWCGKSYFEQPCPKGISLSISLPGKNNWAWHFHLRGYYFTHFQRILAAALPCLLGLLSTRHPPATLPNKNRPPSPSHEREYERKHRWGNAMSCSSGRLKWNCGWGMPSGRQQMVSCQGKIYPTKNSAEVGCRVWSKEGKCVPSDGQIYWTWGEERLPGQQKSEKEIHSCQNRLLPHGSHWNVPAQACPFWQGGNTFLSTGVWSTDYLA